MQLRRLTTVLCLLTFSHLVFGEPDLLKLGPQPLKPTDYRVGERISDVSFQDLAGKTGKLSD